ncbi:Pepco domain-containing protein [Fischerella sp. PCC 9605]|uniref:Pepco domain-containing protein n=1 Tax=Fischerella sp. PCC 9605 TaxID=1173024 RepID=UPI000479DEE8|nr:hypothetical protein [Fischerella sp. PCC 9605]
MSTEISTPKQIWIITEETSETAVSHESTTTRGARSSRDMGGILGAEITETTEVTITKRKAVQVDQLKHEMSEFLQAMREILEEAEQPNSKMQLDEVELSVEINGEGKISLFGVGGKAGGKGAMTFKFKRR